MNIKKSIFNMAALCILLLPLSAMSLTVINNTFKTTSSSYAGPIKVRVDIPNAYALGNQRQADVCWNNITGTITENDISIYQIVSTGLLDDDADNSTEYPYVCLYASGANGNQSRWREWAMNPVVDSPACTIEYTWIDWSQNGKARATPACEYVGRCNDGNYYSASNQNCCPTGFWNSNTNSCSNTRLYATNYN